MTVERWSWFLRWKRICGRWSTKRRRSDWHTWESMWMMYWWLEVTASWRRWWNKLTTVFQMSPYDQVSSDQPVTFCGYEIYKEEKGYGLRQEKYIQELLSRRAVEGKEGQPLPKIVEGEDEEHHELWVVREVQAIVGELQWLATRTRPDLSYSTAFVARLVHRRPAYALKLCHYMLRYLAKYPKMGLFYGEEDQLDTLKVKADTSYGPPHEQYRSVQGVAIFLGSHLLLWTSSRQAFVTLSTAECELVGYTEALQCTESLSSLLELMQVVVPKVLEGDSRAALAQIQNDGGSWRTRHLRLRAWRLREAMADPGSSWRSQHCAGSELAADGLTKALGGTGASEISSTVWAWRALRWRMLVETAEHEYKYFEDMIMDKDYLSMRRRHWRVLGPRWQ